MTGNTRSSAGDEEPAVDPLQGAGGDDDNDGILRDPVDPDADADEEPRPRLYDTLVPLYGLGRAAKDGDVADELDDGPDDV